MKSRVHAIIKGKVQGVFFRAATLEQAKRLGIHGYVKNREDLSVELDAEGNKEQLIQLLQWCQKGPPDAKVESVESEWQTSLCHYSQFTIQRGPDQKEVT